MRYSCHMGDKVAAPETEALNIRKVPTPVARRFRAAAAASGQTHAELLEQLMTHMEKS